MAENGNDWDGKPVSTHVWATNYTFIVVKNDMLQWILDRSARKGKSSDYVIERLLGVSFGAINTTTDVRSGNVELPILLILTPLPYA